MKFLCPQCKAKYQIADEKIERRTLRMKCRRCEFEIVVKGDAASVGAGAAGSASSEDAAPGLESVVPRAAAESAAPKAGPRAAGSALGADFRRQMSAGAASEPPKAAPPAPVDAWHVAINEVPVGPMRRDEVGRKIASGAVDGESLCWREGFDDWRPVKDVAELAPLLRRPAPARPAAPVPGRPLPGPSKPGAAVGRAAVPAPGARPGAGGPAPVAAARANVAPIGGRLGASAAPAFEERPEEFEENEATMVARSPLEAARASASESAGLAAVVGAPVPTSLPLAAGDTAAPSSSGSLAAPPTSAPQAAESAYPSAFPSTVRDEPPRRRAPVSPFVYVAAAGAVAFGVMLAILVAKNTFQPPPAPAPAVAAVAPPAPLPAALPAPTQPLAIPDPAPVAPAVTPVAPVEPVPVPGAPAAHRGSKRPAAAAGNAGRTLSAAEQAEIDRMTGGGAGGPSLAVPVRQMGGGGGGGSQGAELSAEQLRTVVQRNRPGLQHCYEMAARQTGSTDTMRANVEVAVGGSGVVTRVSVTGSAPTQLTTCLESQVRRWHFPAGGEAAFPVVFSPGG